MSETATASGCNYAQVISGICAGDASAMEELYHHLRPGMRWFVRRSIGPQDTDDVVGETFCTALRMIQSGAVREPERLIGYVVGIARNRILNYIQSRVVQRHYETDLEMAGRCADGQPSPEQAALDNESVALAREALENLPARRREVLVRFYLKHQSADEIRIDMGLTATQFRLLKNRAKSEFGQLGKRIAARKEPSYGVLRAPSRQPALQTCSGNIS